MKPPSAMATVPPAAPLAGGEVMGVASPGGVAGGVNPAGGAVVVGAAVVGGAVVGGVVVVVVVVAAGASVTVKGMRMVVGWPSLKLQEAWIS